MRRCLEAPYRNRGQPLAWGEALVLLYMWGQNHTVLVSNAVALNMRVEDNAVKDRQN